MKKTIVAHAFFASFSIASAASLDATSHPKEFCNLASDLGYSSRPYKEITGRCASQMINVTPNPGGNGLKNNLAYYVSALDSNKNKLDYISLILNVNNKKQKSKANLELAKVSISVLNKINGKAPNDFHEVIKNGGSKNWIKGNWKIEVKTTIWPTGQGQDTRVEFSPLN